MATVWLVLFVSLSGYATSGKTLLSAHLVFRHGNRTATAKFPNNPFKEWDQHLGELTNVGKNTEYDLGLAIKKRYFEENKLIRESYVSSEVTIRSSPSDRCLMSAELQAAGMFPPVGDEIWNNNLLWQPIPIHTTKPREDYLLRNFDVDCPVGKKLKSEVIKSPEYEALRLKYQIFIDYVSAKAGKTYNLDNIWEINDVITTQHENKKPIPIWADDAFREKLAEVSFAQNKLLFYTQNKSLRRLLGGYLLFTIASSLRRKTTMFDKSSIIYVGEEQDISKKLHLYSTHDLVIVGLMNVMDIPYDTFLPYGVALSVELYADDQHGNIVEVYMRKSSSGFELVELKACPSPCSLDMLFLAFKDEMVKDLRSECFPTKKENDYLPGFIVFACVSVILLFIVLILLKLPQKLKTRTEPAMSTASLDA